MLLLKSRLCFRYNFLPFNKFTEKNAVYLFGVKMIPKYSHDHHHFSKKKRRNKFNSAILHPNGQSKVQLILKFQAVNICQFLKWRFLCSVQHRIITFFERRLIQYYRDTRAGDARGPQIFGNNGWTLQKTFLVFLTCSKLLIEQNSWKAMEFFL